MASTIKRTNPGDAANIFVRCMLSDLSDMLGGCSKEDIDKTIKYFSSSVPSVSFIINVSKSFLDFFAFVSFVVTIKFPYMFRPRSVLLGGIR